LGTNFSALLNRYRVEEACRLRGDPAFDHLTIDAIGYQAGFQSRSTFYSAFKQIRGETPGQTRRRRS
jgi:AraC-like DNA-binding protein